MHIDWTSLVEVAVVAAAAALTVVLLVALALVELSARPERGAGSAGAHSCTGVATAVLCILAAGLIVGYGLYVIVA